MPRPSWVFASKAIKEGTLTVLQMDAFQALSRLYEVAVELQSTGDVDLVDANLDALMLHPAHVGNTPAGGEKIWGVLRSIELLTSVGTAMPVYRAVLAGGKHAPVGIFWMLDQSAAQHRDTRLCIQDRQVHRRLERIKRLARIGALASARQVPLKIVS